MTTNTRAVWILAMSTLLGAAGCDGAKSHRLPWTEGRPGVITVGDPTVQAGRLNDEGCLIGQTNVCIADDHACDGQIGDVVVSSDGEFLHAVCYPSDSTLTVEQIEQQGGEVAQNQNGAVLVLDGVDDGADLTGDVTLDGNRVVIYGQSPDTSVIGGGLTVEGNQVFVRGVRIQGDVHVQKNGALFAFCVIEGDLIIEGNNTQLFACDVFGDVIIRGNKSQLYGNRFGAGVEVSGNNTSCQDSHAFDDANADGVVSADEVATTSVCSDL